MDLSRRDTFGPCSRDSSGDKDQIKFRAKGLKTEDQKSLLQARDRHFGSATGMHNCICSSRGSTPRRFDQVPLNPP